MDKNVWPADHRPIVAARIASHPYGNEGIMLTCDGWAFERFERNGEMAPIPYLRATRNGYEVEAPLRNWDWVEFALEATPAVSG